MRLAAAILALALLAPAAASAAASHLEGDGAVLVAAGERVVVKIGADGKLTLVSAKPADPLAAAPPKPRSNAPLEDAAAGTVAILLGHDDKGALLKIDSGVDQAFDYTAVVTPSAGARSEPVSVCTVLPLLASYEAWPGRSAAAIRLSSFKLRATNEVICPGRK